MLLQILLPAANFAQASGSEQAAFLQSRDAVTPAEQVKALQHYLQLFPRGEHTEVAQRELLTLLLENFPSETAQLHATALEILGSSDPGFDRLTRQCSLADTFASTGEGGADLLDADSWARSATAAFIESAFARSLAALARKQKLPPPNQKELHRQFTTDRAACILALANVELRENHAAAAETLLEQAARLQPTNPELALLRGELALSRGNDRQGLDLLLRSDAIAPLPAYWRTREATLYAQLDRGTPDEMERRLDAVYRSLNSDPYTLAPRALPSGGHPALLELFTGSDCLPCAAPDLALDSLLSTYGRKDLIALEYDLPVPSPDPLATPDSIQRATFYGVEATPTALLDGLPLPILGSSRSDVENVVLGFADQIEAVAGLHSGIVLQLSALRGPEGAIEGTLQVSLHALGNTPPDETTGDTSLRALRNAVISVALVQNTLSYGGKNGVRLHRMVVRSLQQAPAAEALGGHAITVQFNPAILQTALEGFLLHDATANGSLSRFHFRQTRFPLSPDQLVLVAWVQDSGTHQVLDSAFAVPSLP